MRYFDSNDEGFSLSHEQREVVLARIKENAANVVGSSQVHVNTVLLRQTEESSLTRSVER
jgi:hypothetical protein